MCYRSRFVTLAGFLVPYPATSRRPSPSASSAARSPCPLDQAEQFEGFIGLADRTTARLWAADDRGTAGRPRRRGQSLPVTRRAGDQA